MKRTLALLMTVSQMAFAMPSALDASDAASDKLKSLSYTQVLPQLKLQLGRDSEKVIAELNESYKSLSATKSNPTLDEVLRASLQKNQQEAHWVGWAICVGPTVGILSGIALKDYIQLLRGKENWAGCKIKKSSEILQNLNLSTKSAAAVNVAR